MSSSLKPWALGWLADKEHLIQLARELNLVKGRDADDQIVLECAGIDYIVGQLWWPKFMICHVGNTTEAVFAVYVDHKRRPYPPRSIPRSELSHRRSVKRLHKLMPLKGKPQWFPCYDGSYTPWRYASDDPNENEVWMDVSWTLPHPDCGKYLGKGFRTFDQSVECSEDAEYGGDGEYVEEDGGDGEYYEEDSEYIEREGGYVDEDAEYFEEAEEYEGGEQYGEDNMSYDEDTAEFVEEELGYHVESHDVGEAYEDDTAMFEDAEDDSATICGHEGDVSSRTSNNDDVTPPSPVNDRLAASSGVDRLTSKLKTSKL